MALVLRIDLREAVWIFYMKKQEKALVLLGFFIV
jgi:hypothetical protein